MKVMVTGGSGFFGSHLCRSLLEKKHEVFALSLSGKKERVASLLGHKNFHFMRVDIRDLPALQKIMKKNKMDAVIHLAGYTANGSKELSHNLPCFEINVTGSFNVLQSCLLSGVSKMIFASSKGVYGIPESLPVGESHSKDPSDFYSLTKLQGEILCEYYARNYGFHTIVLRYGGIYGIGKNKGAIYNFTKEVLNGKSPRIFSDGNQTRDFVYIEDAVNATINALNIADEIAFDVFNVGSGRETSINELLGKIIRIADIDIDFKYVPEKSTDRFVLDITKAKKYLYYHPHSLDSGLEEFIGLVKYGGNA